MKKSIMKMLLILDCYWSNFYRLLEMLFMKKNYEALRKFRNDSHPYHAWQSYCRNNKLKHYGGDKWYMGFEAISLPERILARKGSDCDDLAELGHFFFGNNFEYDGAKYKFEGLFCIWSKDHKFKHWVAVWRNRVNNGQPKYFRVSNFTAHFVGEICEGFDLYKKHKGLWVLGHIGVKFNGTLYFKGVYESENEIE